jgi:hypothetical protein
MKTWIVSVPEVWHHKVKVRARSAEEAEEKAEQGKGEAIDHELEYSHTLYRHGEDRFSWSAEQTDDD